MIFVTADQHLYHENIIRMKDRPFSDVHEMSRMIIRNWNEKVGNDDIVYVLGDFVGKEQDHTQEVVKTGLQLKGHKILLKGNHDKCYPAGRIFEEVYEQNHVHEISYGGTKIFMNHFPNNMTFEGDFPDVLYLHAHKHHKMGYNVINTYFGHPYYDVGVDANHFAPVALDTIIRNFQNPPEKLPHILCPKCGTRMVCRTSQYGKFLSCPRCRETANLERDLRTSAEKKAYAASFKTHRKKKKKKKQTESD